MIIIGLKQHTLQANYGRVQHSVAFQFLLGFHCLRGYRHFPCLVPLTTLASEAGGFGFQLAVGLRLSPIARASLPPSLPP